MNATDYNSLLQEDNWKAKCMAIIQRDNCICQDCHRVGIHNNTYFPIYKIEDLEMFFPDILFNGKKLSLFCEECNWTKNLRQPIRLFCKPIENELYFCTMFPYEIPHIYYEFLVNKEIKEDELHFKKAKDDGIVIHYKSKEIQGYMFAFYFKEKIENKNYALISYQCFGNTGLLEMIRLCIYYQNKLYYFKFIYSDFIQNKPIFNFMQLHIHHKYYIKERKPWEYKNEALITLCADCHQRRHSISLVPLYSNEMQVIKHLPICERCSGKGFIPQYHYHYGGICFKCYGEGVYDYI